MVEQSSGAAPELQELLRSLWRRKWVVLLVVAIIMAATIAMTMRQTKQYEASAQVVISLSESAQVVDSSSEGRLEYERDVANELEFIRSDELRSVLAEELGFVPNLRVAAAEGDRFSFAIRGGNPQRLASVANSSAEIYVRERNDRILDEYVATIESIQRQIVALDAEERALLAPIEAFRDSLDPFALDSAGRPQFTDSEVAQYEIELAQLEADAEANLGLISASRGQLRQTQDELRLSSSLQQGAARISRRAPVPVQPVSPNWATNLALGGIAAALCGMAAGLTLEFLDKRIRSASDIRSAVGDLLPIVTVPTAPPAPGQKKGAMAPGGELVLNSSPDSEAAQALWELNGALYYTRLDDDQQAQPIRLLVSSAEPEAGKTFIAANMSLTTSRSGSDTLLVDLDLRRPRVHRMFDLPNEGGASALLAGEPVEPERYSENLQIQVAGRLDGNPVELAARAEQGGLPDQWDKAHVAIFDSPPILAAPEAAIWGSLCDTMFFVVRSGQTKRADLIAAMAKVQALDLEIIIVLSDQKPGRSEYKYANKYQSVTPKRRRGLSRSKT